MYVVTMVYLASRYGKINDKTEYFCLVYCKFNQSVYMIKEGHHMDLTIDLNRPLLTDVIYIVLHKDLSATISK